MKRAGWMIPIVAGLLVLMLGVPGLVQARPACAAMAARSAPSCHEESGPAFLPACCADSPATADCCGEMKTPESTPGTRAAAAPAAPAPAPLLQAPVTVERLHEALARPARLADDPLLHEGTGLYTLHSVLLI